MWEPLKEDGSSPRERGTRTCLTRTGIARPVHPRASGEHMGAYHLTTRKTGSSPRERGTLQAGACRFRTYRFIPARAGNTGALMGFPRPWPVHPRASGEHRWWRSLPWFFSGSSPRERGTPPHRPARGRRSRFIPARAGNTVGQRGGQHILDGSSPRERGTRCAWRACAPYGRFIPARAGNTRHSSPRR